MRKKILGFFVLLLLIVVALASYARSTESSLEAFASSIQRMQRQLPGHFKLSSTTIRIQDDAEMGCWVVLGYVLPEVDLFYTDDDGLLHQKNLPTPFLLKWLKQQKSPSIWLWDSRMNLAGGRFYQIKEIEDASEDKAEVYLKVEGAHCAHHEGQRVNLYGQMGLESMHVLTQAHENYLSSRTSDQSPR